MRDRVLQEIKEMRLCVRMKKLEIFEVTIGLIFLFCYIYFFEDLIQFRISIDQYVLDTFF